MRNKQKQLKIKKKKKAILNQRQADSPLILKEKEIISELAGEKLDEITELNDKVNTGNLI